MTKSTLKKKDSKLPMQGAWVQSLLGELRSCMPQPKKKKKFSRDTFQFRWRKKISRYQMSCTRLHSTCTFTPRTLNAYGRILFSTVLVKLQDKSWKEWPNLRWFISCSHNIQWGSGSPSAYRDITGTCTFHSHLSTRKETHIHSSLPPNISDTHHFPT